ncbi:adenylate/guanylate cyclase domain-containing protein [Leptospira idonii]|uniref:Adenylate/guanylate cyclase domain-containing protein n=1 Tax=Leptospira idonii TaxID=1193500 RepID=A0A4R9M0T0_9LEPT|nr:adenylate/guanylate cyclase domain-containing protein [Leptospira idonii]TGN18839.1 adenylate/guanylate cyclase domain-containing protein [Leptospira idonii]
MNLFDKKHLLHSRMPNGRVFFFSVFGLFLISLFHWWALTRENDFLLAVSLRTYYFPVIYAAVMSSMAFGVTIGALAGLLHFVIMSYFSVHEIDHHNMLEMEHNIEIAFLIVLGAITGIIRDHEKHEREEKEKIRSHFARYLSPQIVEEIITHGEALSPREVSVPILFSDLRNFTTISEHLKPDELLSYLNGYFGAMTEIILKNGGYLDKFIGDAILAVFGVPIPQEGSAQIAVKTAQEMQIRIAELNKYEPYLSFPLTSGIGLHLGKVIAGNVGSSDRSDYTVIGDPVNLASRIENLTKEYNVSILMSDAIVKELDHEILYREIDTVRVKGRSESCVLFEVIL